ncbi:T9SS type A sorting domain-containing protein [Lacibacter sp. H407]|uniref:T9SS type A sorting domain-containing protein n=1 Tax=Lacibacter sp. H407 TaxID=3133423 RepID=UPI0030BDBAAF
MKKFFFGLAVICFVQLISSCNGNKSKADLAEQVPVLNANPIKDRTVNKTSGAEEAMKMEFAMTKDVKLGYVPSDRLVRAVDNALAARRSGVVSRVSALNWVERGPNNNSVGPSNGNIRGPSNDAVTSGRMRAIWVDLADPTNQTVWIGSVSGGLWKTNNISINPANWVLVNDFLGNLAVTSICQDPTNTNIMYFGTGEKTVNADAVRGGGIWKSTDHGVTWNLLPNTTGFWNVSRVLCDAAGNVYVATIGNFGIQRSTNGGASWTSITPTGLTTRVTEMRISNTGRMHIVCGYRNSGTSGYRYTDNPSTVTANSWTEPVTTFPTAYNSELAVSGNVLYVLPANSSYRTPTIYKSIDGGANWAQTTTSPPGGASEPTINASQGWFDLAIGIDPTDPNVVIAGGLNFYRTLNGGETWSQITRWVGNTINYVHADHHSVVWNGSQVLLATDGGIFYSINSGTSFADRNVGLRTKQFYSCAIHPLTTNYFLAGTQDNGTHQLTTPGLGASIEVRGGDGGFVHIDENEPQFQFGSTVYSNYLRSINGGASWTGINYSDQFGLFINPTDYDDINNKMYTSGGLNAGGSYIRWEDPQNGSTFNSVSISAGTSGAITNVKVSSYTNNRVFFGSQEGKVVKVDNAHLMTPVVTNITGSNMPVNNTVSCVETGTSDNNLIATFSNYSVAHVFVTNTGGGAAGWTNITGNLPDIPVRWAMFYPEDDDKAIIATDMGIFETDDINGSSTVWVQNTTFPVVRTNMFQYRKRDGTLLAATHGRGLWTASLPMSVPFVRFASTYNYNNAVEATTATTDLCKSYKDYVVNMRVDQAPVGAATITLSVAGGTAVQGVDFDFTTNGNFTAASNVLTFANGSTAEQPITIRVYNDAEVETEESFTLSYVVSGVTNVLAAPSSQSFTFNISSDDAAPVVPSLGEVTVGSGNYGSYVQPLRGSFAKARSQYIYTAAELIAAGVQAGDITSLGFNVTSKGSTTPFTGLTVSLKNTSSTILSGSFEAGATVCYTGNYSTFLGVNTLNFNVASFGWDGVSNLLVEICYNNIDNAVTGDDNLATNITADQKGIWGRTATGVGCEITGGLFGSVAGTFVRPNIILPSIVGNAIETVVNSGKLENVAGSGTYNFYRPVTNKVISRISGASASLGCVTSNLSASGTTWQSFFAGPRSQKVVDVAVSTNPSATYTLSLYFTVAELNGKTPGALKIAGTTAATLANADVTNSTVYATNFVTYGATGYVFTATVTGAGKFFLAEGNVTSIRNPSQQENFVKLLQNPISTTIPLSIGNQSRVNIEATLFTNNGQLLQRWNLGRADGNRQLPLSGKALPAGVYILRIDAGTKTQSLKVVKQ